MYFEITSLVIFVAAIALFPAVNAFRRKAGAVPGLANVGWNKLYIALSLFSLTGFLSFLLTLPRFMSLFVPAVAEWLEVLARLSVAGGILMMIWGLAGIVAGVRRFSDQQHSDESWQKFYVQLQELSTQPFSFVEILNLSLKELLARSESDGAAVLLFKENSSELILGAFSGLPPETTKKLERLKLSGDLFSRAQKLGRAQHVVNLSDSEKMTEELFSGSGFLSAGAFPLRAHDKVLGAVGLFSFKPYHYAPRRAMAITVAANHLGILLESVRAEKEIARLRETLKPSEEAKRITEELFFRRGIGGNLELREALEFERVRKFFDADCIKLVAHDDDGEFRIKASSGGAELGLKLDRRKLEGINRATADRKLLLLTAPRSSSAGAGYDAMPKQTLFVPIPYPDRDDLVLLLESDADLEFSREKLSAVRVASVYLADLFFLFLEKRQGEKYRHSISQIEGLLRKMLEADTGEAIFRVLAEAAGSFLPQCRARLAMAFDQSKQQYRLFDHVGLQISGGGEPATRGQFYAALFKMLLASTAEGDVVTKSGLSALLPAEFRERFEKVFAKLPENIRQSVLPFAHGADRFGAISLYFTGGEEIPSEALHLFERLTELAAFCLSLQKSVRNPISNRQVTDIPSENTGVRPGLAEFRQLKILSIDDQEVIRELLVNILSSLGHRVVTVSDGEEGLNRFRQEKFDLVIAEAGLPRLDGWEVAREIKILSPTTPVIILSGWSVDERATDIQREGADFVLTKPFKMEQLDKILSEAAARL